MTLLILLPNLGLRGNFHFEAAMSRELSDLFAELIQSSHWKDNQMGQMRQTP
jgi:hypothetical protein